MHDMPPSYDPSKVTIHVGDTVEWQNVGNSVHQASDDQQIAAKGEDVATPAHGDVFDSGFMRPGETFTHTFVTLGIYKYFCSPHETDGMIGEIIVEPAS
jgi:plastocyanin